MQHSRPWLASLVCAAALAGCRGTDVDTDPAPERADAPAAAVPDAARGKTITGACTPNAQYSGNGLASLVDGKLGSDDYQDYEWLGWWYEEKPFDVTIDLGATIAIRELGVHALASSDVWIFLPRKVQFDVSADGKDWQRVATIEPEKEELENEGPETKTLKASDLDAKGRYLRVRATSYGELPDWHMGHGGADGYEGKAWLFLDEILVNPSQ